MSDEQGAWTVKSFAEIATVRSSQVSPLETPYLDYYHIGPENVESGTGRLSGLKTARELHLVSGKYIFDSRAIVYSKIRPNLNKVCLPDFEGVCSADMYPIWPKNAVAREYLFYYMLSEAFVWQATRVSMRTGMPKINRQDLSKVKVGFPPLPEQRKIAEILGTWGQAIALTERRIEAARQRKKGLMQRLLTGRVRFPEFEVDGWREVQLGRVFTERKERGHEDLPLLSVTANEGIVYRDELDRRDTSSADKSKYLRVREGDIAYNTMRMWQGRSGVSGLEGIVSPAYTVCEPKSSIDEEFMGYLFQLPSIVYLFRRYSQGLVSDTWNLKFKHFAQIRVRIPEIREQRRIAAVLRTCDREIELLIQKRDALLRQKKGLMQRLLTGRVRVKV
jgi:type I restriction enzyme S subunit